MCPLTYKVLLLYIILFISTVVRSVEQHEYEWVDPDSHLLPSEEARLQMASWEDPDYRPSSLPKKPLKKKIQKEQHLTEVRKKLNRCEVSLQNLQATKPPDEALKVKLALPPVDTETIYLRRFVGLLIDTAGLSTSNIEPGEMRHSGVSVKVDHQQLAKLRMFVVKGDTSMLKEVDKILSEVLTSIDDGYFVPPGFWEDFKSVFSDMVLSDWTPKALSLFFILMITYRQRLWESIFYFTIVIFIFGLQGTYKKLIEEARVDQKVAQQFYAEMPASCRYSEGWFGWFGTRAPSAECRNYHAAHTLPAEVGVTLTLALSDMITTFIVHPMGKLGTGMGQLTAGFMGQLSWLQSMMLALFMPLILILCAIVILAVVVLLCGSRVRFLPFLFGGAEIDTRATFTDHYPAISSSHHAPIGAANIEARIREELLVHRIVQQLAPLPVRDEMPVMQGIQQITRVQTVGDEVRREQLTITSADVNLMDAAVSVGDLIDFSSMSNVEDSSDDGVDCEVSSVEVFATKGTASGMASVSRIEEVSENSREVSGISIVSGVENVLESRKVSTNESVSRTLGFLDSLEELLKEPVSVSEERDSTEASRSEFITSIERIMMDSEEKPPSRTSSSESSGGFIKL